MPNLDEELKEELEITADQYLLLRKADPDNPLLDLVINKSGIGEFTQEFYDKYFNGNWVDALISYAVDLSNAIPSSDYYRFE